EPTNHLDIHTIRWLEGVLRERSSTMIIISHDRHFLNSVCTHMADLDYGELRLFPGNYDEYMTAATQARERLLSDNAKKKAQIAELQQFVSRFSANASKAKQATSRARQIDKIQLEEVKPSSRVSPFIRFEQHKKLHRQAATLEQVSQGYDGQVLFRNLSLQIAELQQFVSRFSANASKAKQATSRARQIDKIQLEEVKPSSRVSPFIRFEQHKKLHRQAVTLEQVSQGYDGQVLFRNLSLQI